MKFAVARLGALAFALLAPALAIAALTVTPITFNVVGLDSNSPASGPKYFPVGARVCSNVATTNVTAAWAWDSANPNINVRAGSLSSLVIPAIAAGACADAYFEIEVNQVAAAFDTTRRYHVTATDGSGSFSSPTPREIYVEHLISQSRNAVTGAKLNGVPIPAGGSVALVLGNTYTIELDSGTATQGYNQFESFINFSNAIFQIQSVTTAYSADNSPYVSGPAPATSNKLYADACLWDNNPGSPNYRSCIGGDFKSGGSTITTTYVVKIIGGGGTAQTLSTLLYDFSGSSYHYNADFSVSSWIANIVDPTALSFAKAFSPAPAVAGGTSTLTFTIANPNAAAIGGASFGDTLPSLAGNQMVVASPATFATSGCGAATFAPVAGASSVSFANGTVAANSSCTVSVLVAVPALPTSGTYANVSGNLFVGSVDSGHNATANLGLVTVAPPASSCGLTLASWDFATALPNPTTKRADVTVATAAAGAGLNAAIDATGNPTPSWKGSGFSNQASLSLGNNDYFEFTVDTRNYTSVSLSFDAIRSSTGPVSAQVYTSIDGGTTLTPQGTFAPGVAFGSFSQSPTPTSTTGNTLFRIYGWNASNSGANATLNLDNITITGCQTAAPPTLTKTFTTNPVAVGGSSTLQFTLTNPGSNPLTGIKFSDSLPGGMQTSSAPSPTTTCGGSPTWTPGPGATTLDFGQVTGATLAAAASCTVSVKVIATTAGPHTNVSGFVSSTEGGTNTGTTGSAIATLTALQPPSIAKVFSASPILVGAPSLLTLTIQNPNPGDALNGVSVADTYPSGMVNANPLVPAVTNTCGGAVTATPGGNALNLSGGSIAPGSSCAITVPVTSALAGTYLNVTGAVSGAVGGSGNTASATLMVNASNPAINLAKRISTSATGPWMLFLAVTPGTPLYYQFTAENIGDVPLNPFSVSDPTLAGTGADPTNCVWQTTNAPTTLPALPVASATIDPTATCVTGPITAALGPVTNTATAHGTFAGLPHNSSAASANYIGAVPGFSLVKQIAPTATGPWAQAIGTAAGANVFYKFTVINTGGLDLNTIGVTDPTENTASCSFTNSLVIGQATVCVIGPVITAGANGSTTPNTAIAHGTNGSTIFTPPSTASYTIAATTADLSITKDDGATTVTSGSNTTYTIVLANAGPGAAANATFSDVLPTGMTFVSISPPPGWSCLTPPVGTGGTISCSIANLNVGSNATFTIVAGVGASVANGTLLTNTATASSDAFDPIPGNNSASDADTVGTSADLAITKTDGASSVNAGANTVYTITVTNNGPSDASGAILTDAAAAGLAKTAVTCSGTPGACVTAPTTPQLEGGGFVLPTLSVGASYQILVTTMVTAANGTVTNVATVTAPAGLSDPVAGNNSASDADTVLPLADVSIVKTLITAGPYTLGQSINYTLLVANAGPSTATNLQINDTPSNLTITNVNGAGCVALPCTIASLASGANVTISVTAMINAVGAFDNSSTATGTEGDPNPANNTDNTGNGGIATASAEVSIVKTLVSAGPYTAGQALTYSLVVANAGPSAATSIQVTDTPSNLTITNVSGGGCAALPCTIASLSSGANVTISVTATINSAGTFDNSATATAAELDPNPANNTDNTGNGGIATPPTPLADLSVVKTDGVVSVSAGANTTYSITVNNGGPDAAANASFTDPLPAGMTFVSLSSPGGWSCSTPAVGAGGSITCSRASMGAGIAVFTLGANVGAGIPPGTLLTNTATVSTTTIDPNPANNSASDADLVTPALADLVIGKTGTATVSSNGAVTYSLVVSNNGPAAADGAVVKDAAVANFAATGLVCGNVSGGATCPGTSTVAALQGAGIAIPTLPSGGSVTFTLSGTASVSGAIANVATVAVPANITDNNPANNSSTANTSITSTIADLSVQKSGPAQVLAGGQVTYTVQLVNLGPAAANGAVVTDSLPAGLTSPQLTACTAAGGATCPALVLPAAVTGPWTIPTLPAGGGVTLTAVGTAPAAIGTLVNLVSVVPPAGISDPNASNDTSQITTQVITTPPASTLADLGIVKSGPAAVGVGGSVTYSVIISNAGPAAANGAVVTDTLPAGLQTPQLTACTTTGGATCPAVTLPSAVSGPWTLPALPAGGSVTLTMTGSAPAAPGSLTNSIIVAPPAGITDPDLANNTAQAITAVNPTPPANTADVLLTKTGPGTVAAGAPVSYTLQLLNLGPDAADGTVVTDTLPAALSSPQLTACVPSGGASCPALVLPQPIVGTLSVTVPTLPLNGSVALTVTGTAPSVNASFTNMAQAQPPLTVTDPNLANNVGGPVTTGVLAVTDLAITKSDGVGAVTPGGSTTYTITVTNNGPSEVTNATVADVAPAGLTFGTWTCAVNNFGAGGAVTTGCGASSGNGDLNTTVTMKAGAVVVYTVPATVSAAATGSVANTATVTASLAVTDPDAANNSATDTDAVVPAPVVADLAITKTNGVGTVNAGGSTTYMITVTNNGPSSVSGALLTDPAVAGLIKTGVVCSGTPGSCIAPPSVAALEAGSLALPTLANGATYQIAVTATVVATNGTVANTATIAAPGGASDPTPGNNSATDSDPVIAAPVLADLAITKSDGVSSIAPGGNTTYIINVTNNGPAEVSGATVTDLAPIGLTINNWTCVVSNTGSGGIVTTACGSPNGSGNINATVTLKVGAVVTFTVPATVAANATGTLVNIATVNLPADVTDPTPANNSARDSDAVTNRPPPKQVAPIPTLGPLELALLILLLGAMSARFIAAARSSPDR